MQHLNRRTVDALIEKHAPDDRFVSDYEALLVKEGTNWFLNWYPDMAQMDERIPGVGLHWLQWQQHATDLLPRRGWYPHAHSNGYKGWDLIIRPLRYFPMDFMTACPSQHTMSMALNSIESVEECLKKLGLALGLNVRGKTMGSLCGMLSSHLGGEVCSDIMELNRWLIMAKHISQTPLDRQQKEHRIDLDEATGLYYASRLLGAVVLSSCEGLVEDYAECAGKALSDGQGLQVAYTPHYISLTPWSIVDPYPTYDVGRCSEPDEDGEMVLM